jgi:hypothetical protein
MSPFFLAYNVLASGSVVHGVLSSLPALARGYLTAGGMWGALTFNDHLQNLEADMTYSVGSGIAIGVGVAVAIVMALAAFWAKRRA